MILNLYNDGNGTHKISKMMGISKKTVSRILKSNNVKIRNDLPKTKLNIVELIRLYNSGITFTEIGNMFNTTSTTISRLIKDKVNYVKTKDRITILNDNDKQIIEKEYLDKKSIFDISEIIDKHPEVIRRYLNSKNMIRSFEERKKLASIKLSNKLFKSSLHKYIDPPVEQTKIFTTSFNKKERFLLMVSS
jgi:DNA-directed RNA polymerase specialized sigma subunit